MVLGQHCLVRDHVEAGSIVVKVGARPWPLLSQGRLSCRLLRILPSLELVRNCRDKRSTGYIACVWLHHVNRMVYDASRHSPSTVVRGSPSRYKHLHQSATMKCGNVLGTAEDRLCRVCSIRSTALGTTGMPSLHSGLARGPTGSAAFDLTVRHQFPDRKIHAVPPLDGDAGNSYMWILTAYHDLLYGVPGPCCSLVPARLGLGAHAD